MGAQRKHPGLAEGAGRGRTARPWAQEGWDYSFLFVPACTVPGTQQVFNWYLKGQKARPAPTPQSAYSDVFLLLPQAPGRDGP